VTAPVVAIDLDDVSADRLGVIAARLADEGHRVGSRYPRRWDLGDWGVTGQEHYDRLHYGAFGHADGYARMPPIEGAVEGIRALHEMGCLIRILTGRLWTAQVVRSALAGTGRWLDHHAVPVDDVAFVADKTAVSADVYVEDAPHFIKDLQAAGRDVIVLDRNYNRHLPGERTSDWPELTRMISHRFHR
jgi:hypothetical protein